MPALITATGQRLWEAVFPRTAEGIAAFGAREITGAHLAVEATGPTWAFVDAVTTLGVHACVVDPRKTKIKAGFAAKTDRLDARRLADALRRDSVVSIDVPPPPIRELRELTRGRQQVVRVRTKLVQVMRALLLRQDVADPPVRTLTSRAGLTWLASVHLGLSSEGALRRLERLLHAAHAEARAADVMVRAAAADDPIARTLTRLVGVGPVLSLVLRAEIGTIDRFPRGAALACYAGIVSRVDASATRYDTGAITRAGSPWLRWALVEVALHAMKTAGSAGPLGASARSAERDQTCARRVGAALMRRDCRDMENGRLTSTRGWSSGLHMRPWASPSD